MFPSTLYATLLTYQTVNEMIDYFFERYYI